MKLSSSRNRFLLICGILSVFVLLLFLLPHAEKKFTQHIISEIGLDLEFDDIGGSLVTNLTFARIKGARKDESQVLSKLDVRDLRIEYSLPQLILGVNSFLASVQIDASQAYVVVDLNSKEQQSQSPPDSSLEFILPKILPGLKVDDLDLEIQAPGYKVTFEDSHFSIDQKAKTAKQLIASDISLLQLDIGDQEKYQTSGTVKLYYSEGGILLENLMIPDLLSLIGSINFEKIDHAVSWKLQGDFSEGQVQSSGSFSSGQSNIELELENVDIGFLANMSHIDNFPVTGRISADTFLHFSSMDIDTLVADLDIALSESEMFGQTTDALLQGNIKGDNLFIKKLIGHFGKNEIVAEEGNVALPFFRSWGTSYLANATMKSIQLHLQDIPFLMQAFGYDIPRQDIPQHSIDLWGSLGDGKIEVYTADFTTPKNKLHLSGTELQIPSTDQSFLDAPLSGKLLFRFDDLNEVSNLTGLPAISGEGQGKAIFNGSLRKPAGTISLDGNKLAYKQCALEKIAIHGQADSNTVTITSLLLENENDYVKGQGQYSIDSQTFVNVEGEIVAEDVGQYFNSCLALKEEVSGTLKAVFVTTGKGELQANIEIEEGDFAGISLQSLSGAVTTDWVQYRIDDAKIDSEFGNIRFSTTIIPEKELKAIRTDFTELIIVYSGTDFSLSQPASLLLDYSKGISINVDEMLLKGNAGEVFMQGLLAQEQESSFQVKATNLTSSGWLDELTGKDFQVSGADITASLHGPLVSPRIEISSQIEAISFPQLPESMSGDLNLSYIGGEGFTVNQFQLATGHEQRITLTGHIPLDPLAKDKFIARPLSLSGNIMIPRLKGISLGGEVGEAIDGELSGEFKLSGTLDSPEGKMHLKGSNFFLHNFLKNAPQEPVTFDCLVSFLPGRINLEVLKVESTPFSISAGGTWSDISSVPGLILKHPAELPGTVSFNGKLSMPDVSWLASYITGLRRFSGRIESSFSINGQAAEPTFSGNFRLTEGNLRLASLALPPLNNLTVHAFLEENTINLEEMNGRMGGAPVQVSGSYTFGGKAGPSVNCRLTGSNVLIYRDDTIKIRADADLVLSGPLSRLNLKGKLGLTDSRYTKNVDFLSLFRESTRPKAEVGMQFFSFEEPPLSDMVFDVRIEASEPFMISNYMAKGSVRPALRLSGTGEIPVIIGRIYVDQTKLIVPAGKLIVDSGVITFPENNPDRPAFNLKASSRLAGYDISLYLQGTSDAPVITLSSDPPLPDDDLLLLVLTGRLPQSDKDRKALANMKMAVYLGRGLLASWFGESSVEDDESILERFDLELGRELSKTGQETVEVRFRLIEGILLPGDRLYITSEKDVYDNINAGVKIVFRFK